MNKIQIKDINGNVIFECKKKNNTIEEIVEEAVRLGYDLKFAYLHGADFSYANLEGANLSYADLSGANLSYANLSGADLRCANLSGADLRCAKLMGAEFYCTNLRGANLSYADLYKSSLANTKFISAILNNANLSEANLSYADLYNANLNGANLRGAHLIGANLNGADLENVDFTNANLYGVNLGYSKNIPDNIPMACPEKGSFIAWKKVKNYLIKLEIPEDAERSSATTNKCRCDKAKVLEIIDVETNKNVKEVINYSYASCIYQVGEMVYPDFFDENRWVECSNGIHFFMDIKDAINYC